MDKNTKEQILNIVDSLKKISGNVSEGIITNKELEDSFSSAFHNVKALLDPTSFEYKKLDAWKHNNYLWTSRVRPGYATNSIKIDNLAKVLLDISGYQRINSEYHFSVAQEYEIRRFFSKLFSIAKNEIIIVDNYFDSNIFEFIEEINSGIQIKLLGSSSGIKSAFKSIYKCYPGKNVECRTHDDSSRHDRFIVLDGDKILQVGASLNGIGKKEFTIKELDDSTKIEEIFNAWENSQKL